MRSILILFLAAPLISNAQIGRLLKDKIPTSVQKKGVEMFSDHLRKT